MISLPEKIQDLIDNNPKHYSAMIKRNPELLSWVMDNTTADSEYLPTHIFSAITQQSNICQYGNKKELKRWVDGFKNCGPAKVCECTRMDISTNVSCTKKNYSIDKIENISAKRSATMIEKYGVEYNSQREDIKHLWKKPKIELSAYEKLIDREWMTAEYVNNKRTAVDIADELGVYYSTVIEYCKHHEFEIRQNSNYSLTELEIQKFIEQLGFTCSRGNWGILDCGELDLFVESSKLAIEVNGLYWHSYHPDCCYDENEQRHLKKTIECESKGITLMHITDWEWKNKKDIIKSIIMSKLNINERIYARKCEIVILDSVMSKHFFNENHLQGHINATIYIGLRYDGKIVQAISAGKSRFDNGENIELLRLASVKNINVVGGASKLLSHLKKITGASEIFTYCDRSKSGGSGYKAMGMKLIRETKPGYFWTDGNQIISRYKSQKKQLAKWMSNYDSELTESCNMFNNGFRRYWDCGNLVFKG